MDGLRSPVGDQPPQVYWRRRLAVLAGALVLGLVIWFLVSATLSGNEGDPAAAPTVSPDATETTSADPGDPNRACTDADVTLTSEPTPEAVQVGGLPAFEVSVEHTGTSACRLTTTADGTELLITSGSDRIYSSTDCPDDAAFAETEWLLQPGNKEALTVTWNGKRSQPGCEPVSAEPRAGTYKADVSIQAVAAPQATFQLTD